MEIQLRIGFGAPLKQFSCPYLKPQVWLLILRQSCRNVVSATYYYLYVNFVQEDKYNKISQTKYINI